MVTKRLLQGYPWIRHESPYILIIKTGNPTTQRYWWNDSVILHYLNHLLIQKDLKILFCCLLIMNFLRSGAFFTRAAQQSFHILRDWLLQLIVFHFLYYFNLLPIFIYTGFQLHSLVSQNDLFIACFQY